MSRGFAGAYREIRAGCALLDYIACIGFGIDIRIGVCINGCFDIRLDIRRIGFGLGFVIDIVIGYSVNFCTYIRLDIRLDIRRMGINLGFRFNIGVDRCVTPVLTST